MRGDRMIAEHQSVKIHLHKIARRAEHILGDKHIFHGCGIKQRGAVIKRAKRHISSPFASFFIPFIVSQGGGELARRTKRSESTALPPPPRLIVYPAGFTIRLVYFAFEKVEVA